MYSLSFLVEIVLQFHRHSQTCDAERVKNPTPDFSHIYLKLFSGKFISAQLNCQKQIYKNIYPLKQLFPIFSFLNEAPQ